MYGGAVARKLVERGDQVRAFQRRPAGVEGVEEVLGSVTDADAVRAAVQGAEAVIHMAAKVTVSGAYSGFAEVNVDGVRNVLDAVAGAGVGRLVHISSPSVAHAGHSLVGAGAGPADPDRARGHYSRSKATGELMALAADGPDLAVTVLRPHLMWGPGDTQLIGRIIDRARSGRLALVGPGTALIDTTYVDNAVDATLAALDRCEQAHGQALVISNGEPRTVAELFERACQAAGVAPTNRHVPFPLAWGGGAIVEAAWSVLQRTDDPPITRFLAEQLATAHWFDQRNTREVLAWEPVVGLEEGFQRLADWYAQGARDQLASAAAGGAGDRVAAG
jgi:nucleoside-diphosphate-sugar epimerase